MFWEGIECDRVIGLASAMDSFRVMFVAPSRKFTVCLTSIRRSLGLYLFHLVPVPSLSSVITLRDGREVIENKFQGGAISSGGKIENLQGAKLTAITLPWPPYILSMDDCRDGHKDCKAVGPLMEIMDILGELYNFTTSVDRDPDKNWGTKPVTGKGALNTGGFSQSASFNH